MSYFLIFKQPLIQRISLIVWFCSSLLAASANEHPARIRTLEGRTIVQHFGQSSGRILPLNYPIWEGDRLSLGEKARLEVEFHDGSLMRLGPGTEVTIRRMTDERVQVHLISGALALQSHFPERYELFTNSTYFYPDEEGHYYLSREAGREVARVLEGRARVSYGGSAWNLLPGEGLFDGSVQVDRFADSELSLIRWDPSRTGRDYPPGSSWDGGSLPYGGGLELSLYGHWGRVGAYGRVWWPRVHSSWTPYRDGRWVHHPRRGRIWISQAPWGWLPDHYGDWVFVRQYSRWCWVPGDLGRWSPGRSGPRFGARSRPAVSSRYPILPGPAQGRSYPQTLWPRRVASSQTPVLSTLVTGAPRKGGGSGSIPSAGYPMTGGAPRL